MLEANVPFVCKEKPFVCSGETNFFPLVGFISPSVYKRGFTLIELIVTLTIAAILMTVAAPSFSKFLASNRLATQINDLVTDINYARSEAIKRSTTTGLCVSPSGTACLAGGDWAKGWIVYADVGGVTTVLRKHESLSGGNTLTHTPSADSLVFNKGGLLKSGAGNFTLCDSRLGQSRVLNIAATGRPALTEGTCS